MIVFWEYDRFPYCLWGELKCIRGDGEYVEVKGYDGLLLTKECIIAIVSKEKAEPIIRRMGLYIDAWETFKYNMREKVDLELERMPGPHWNILLDEHEIGGAL